MAARTPREAGGGAGAADGALDRLYGEPFDDFVRLRKEMAAALRAAGDVAASRLVMKAAKPSRTAWALNQVARRRPELVQAAFEARAKAADAQTSGEGEALRATARAYRERLASLVDAASDAVRQDGGELTVAQGRRISATVQAVAGADDERHARGAARRPLRRGRRRGRSVRGSRAWPGPRAPGGLAPARRPGRSAQGGRSRASPVSASTTSKRASASSRSRRASGKSKRANESWRSRRASSRRPGRRSRRSRTRLARPAQRHGKRRWRQAARRSKRSGCGERSRPSRGGSARPGETCASSRQ